MSRATLELTARRHLSDATMCTLLGLDAEALETRRHAAADALAAELGTTRERAWARARELPEDEWPGGPASPPVPEAIVPQRFDEAARWRLLATAALVVVAVGGLVALVSRGDTHRAADSATAPAAASTPAPAAPAPARPASGPSGTAVVSPDGRRVRVAVRGLDPGTYALWLYTDVIGARRLAALRGPGGTLTVPLPADARSFAKLDLSRQPGGRTDGHSGLSVLRVATTELRPGAAVRLARPGI
ncbi:MAG: hypothetical protein QOH43_4966 [Solirubrobacteraceae bacterium]|nr:hypothetical protein [Solirubrobacteraceae bacterium]